MNGISPAIALNTQKTVHSKIPGDNNGDGKVDYKDFFCSFKHLFAIVITSAIVIALALKWTEFFSSFFARIFAHEFWNPLLIKFITALLLTVIGVCLIFVVHKLFGICDHIEDHMS